MDNIRCGTTKCCKAFLFNFKPNCLKKAQDIKVTWMFPFNTVILFQFLYRLLRFLRCCVQCTVGSG